MTIGIGGSAAIGTTGADGRVTLQVPLTTRPGELPARGVLRGRHRLPALVGDSEPFAIAKAQASLSIFLPNLIVTPGGATGIDPTLTASVGGKKQPLLQLTVTFTVFRPGLTKTFSTITDYLGRATLPPTGLAAGVYFVTASFAGDATYTAATRASVLLISQFTGFLSAGQEPADAEHRQRGQRRPDQIQPWRLPRLPGVRTRLAARAHDQLHDEGADRPGRERGPAGQLRPRLQRQC